MDMNVFSKGQIWWYKCPPYDVIEKEDGVLIADRYVIIYQGERIGCKNRIMTIPCTATSILNNGVNLSFETDVISRALIQDMKPINVKYLKKFVGQLNQKVVEELDIAVSLFFGLMHDDALIQKYFPINHECDINGEYMFVQSNILNTTVSQTNANSLNKFISTHQNSTLIHTNNISPTTKIPEPLKSKGKTKPLPENFPVIAKQVFDGEINTTTASSLCSVCTTTFNNWYYAIYKEKPKKSKSTKHGPHSSSKDYISIDLTSLSNDELLWFMGADVKKIRSKYNIAFSTVYRYRKIILEKNLIPCSTDYNDKVYQQFKGKKLNLLSKEDKILFVKLDPVKIEKFTGLGISTVNTYMTRFKNELKQ